METNAEGEEVEVKKKVMQDVKPLPISSGAYWDQTFRYTDQKEAFTQAVAAPNGKPIWSKSGWRSYPKKVVRRTNDGDVRYYDYNDPECPKDTRIDNAMWFLPVNWNNTIQSYREISGNPDGLWPEIK